MNELPIFIKYLKGLQESNIYLTNTGLNYSS